MPIYYKNLEGWFDFENLYDDLILNKLPQNSIFVEVGVWKGKSICYFAEKVKRVNKKIHIYGIDIFSNKLDDLENPYKVSKNTFNNYLEFLLNLIKAKIIDIVTPIALFSEDASLLFENNSIDCIFIDGAHDKKSVYKDLNFWYPKIKTGGYICGHDYRGGINLKPIIDEYFFEKLNKKVIEYPPSSFIYKKE